MIFTSSNQDLDDFPTKPKRKPKPSEELPVDGPFWIVEVNNGMD